MRDKDHKLARDCKTLRESCLELQDWVADNTKIVGNSHEVLTRKLKLRIVDANRLARASNRPTSLAIFGPSQVGKSFLMGTLIGSNADDDHAGNIIFGSDNERIELNFLKQVNPSGGKETTGLVTRFTTSAGSSTPPGFPVSLRFLREIDLVKILVNSSVYDLSKGVFNAINADVVVDAIAKAERCASNDYTDLLRQDDIYELERYHPTMFVDVHPLYKDDLKELYWTSLARFAPYLNAESRTEFYSLLWGKIPQFTELFLELKTTLDNLGHPETIYVGIDSILDRTPGKTILHVETMKVGLADDRAKSEIGELALASGKTFKVRKPVITALASELRAELASRPWDFFENTDLLDFPGARSRKPAEVDEYFNAKDADTESEKYPIGEAFLRGKVAVLFDNYSTDLDLNILLACHKAEPNEVVSFPDLVRDWVKRTYGETAEDRSGKGVNLFMVVTWCDKLLERSVGQTDIVVTINSKLSFFDRFRSILANWTPGESFKNSYLIRNPAGNKLEGIFNIKDIADNEWLELGVRSDRQEMVEHYKSCFTKTEIAENYFSDPDKKFQAILEPDDGGVSYLARAIGPACNPDVKYNQILPKAVSIKQKVNQLVSPYYEGEGAEERVVQRESAIQEIIEILKQNLSVVPAFISVFQLASDQIASVYLSYKQTQLYGVNSASKNVSFGQEAIRYWINVAERKYEDESLASRYGLTSDQMKRVADELQAGFRVLNVSDRIQEEVDKLTQYAAASPRHADQVGACSGAIINEFISYLGSHGHLKLEELSEATLFDQPKRLDENGMPVLEQKFNDMRQIRNQYMSDWLDALLHLTRINARSSSGGLIDIEQNMRLGNSLKKLNGMELSGN